MGIGQIGSLKGKVVVVTGAGRGIGQTISETLAREGATLVIAARTQSELEKTRAHAEKLGAQCQAIVCDVAKEADVSHLFSIVQKSQPEIHGVICAAGIHGPIGPFEEATIEDWEYVLQINVLGSVRCAKAALPLMKKGGRIIFFSGAGQTAMPRFVPYATSKGAIWRLTESLGAELAEKNIFVNAIAPGAVNTQLLNEVIQAGPKRVGEEYFKKVQKMVEEGGTPPTKAADLAVFLLSAQAKGLFGKVLSAAWDPYRELKDLSKVSESDLYTFKRVVNPQGGTR